MSSHAPAKFACHGHEAGPCPAGELHRRTALGYCAAAFMETAAYVQIGGGDRRWNDSSHQRWPSPRRKAAKASGYDQLTLFGEAFERIRQDAVEPVTEAKLIAAAIAGMLSGLDARSVYLSEAAFRGVADAIE